METLLRRDRLVALAGLALLATLAWAVVLTMAGGMRSPEMALAMPETADWGADRFPPLFGMWAVMMVAMMLPSAAPVVLLVAGMNRGRRARGEPSVPTSVFLLGYLLTWTVYAALAAGAQVALHDAALLSPGMASASPILGGALLVAAGVFQFTPLKDACLRHCRSPFHVLGTEWREGAAGALRLGLRHGTYCVGCCWLVMALLFVVGVMNVLWVAALAAFVLVEKAAPGGPWIGRTVGGVLVAWGVWLLAQA